MKKSKNTKRQRLFGSFRRLLVESLEDRRMLTSGLELLMDIYPDAQQQHGMQAPIQIGDHLYFRRHSEVYGFELWKSDGTPDGTSILKDIFPGQVWPSFSSDHHVTHLTDVNGTLFFGANDGVHGFELWKSNGTPEGTQLVKDIRPGSNNSISTSAVLSGFTNVNGTLFFAATDGTHGMELWKSDGTEQGTMMVKDIAWGILGSNPRELKNVNGTLYFQANDGVNGAELWKSDGTPQGTVMVKDIRPGSAGSTPSQLAELNGILYFRANDGTHGFELWRSDGTSDGTFMVRDIRPNVGYVGDWSSNPAQLTNINGYLYFVANDGQLGNELWISDGTSGGTLPVKDIRPGLASSDIGPLTNVNGTLFFVANDGSSGSELWKSDGTAAGTVLVRDVRPGSTSSFGFISNRILSNIDGILYFVANDGSNGYQLWKSDGSTTGTQRITDIQEGGLVDRPAGLIGFNDKMFFSTNQDIWSSDGTTLGTSIAIPGITERGFIHDPGFVKLDDFYVFNVNDGIHGFELWRTDGTTENTFMVTDLNPGPAHGFGFGGFGLGILNGQIVFLGGDPVTGGELWKTDGTESGTQLVMDIRPGGSSNPVGFQTWNEQAYFSADDGIHGRELWKTDGTSAGTSLFKDINPGPAHSYPIPRAFTDDTLFLRARDEVYGSELWKTDGTAAGTVMVKDIRPGSGSSYPFGRAVLNGVLLFSANDGTHGNELWKSDGTTQGTTLLKDIQPGGGGSSPENFVLVNQTLFFSANTASHGRELWMSDGTVEGTVLVKDIWPGPQSANVQHLVNINGTLYFSAYDGIHGDELWTSDGTAEGTKMVANLTSDSGSSQPQVVGDLGNGKLLVLATTAAYGRELFVLQLPGDQASVQASYVYHVGSSFVNSGIENALDTSKQLAKEGQEPLTLSYDNLINSSRGINGLVFDIQNLPGGPSANLTVDDFEFQMSPTGAFIEADHPPANWSNAPAPSSISVVAGSQSSPDRVVLQWPDNAIANRWLRVTVKASANTGLLEAEVYYIGHLLGETTGASGGVYTVSFADVSPIRAAVGQSVNAGSIHDIDKNGTVAFADISAMRPNVGVQLTNITIPAGNASSGESGGERLSGLQSGTGKGRVGGAGRWSQLQMPAVPMSSTLPTTSSRPTANRPDVIQTHSGLPENKPLLKAEGVETRDPWLGELDVLLEDAAIVRYWTSDSAVEEVEGIELLRLTMERSLKSRIAPPIQ
jgi:ELWxxDGT repeat protein